MTDHNEFSQSTLDALARVGGADDDVKFNITNGETLIDNGEVVTSCYGELREDSNFDVVCEDEEFDEVWCNANPEGGSFTTWAEVVRVLQNFYDSPIVQIESC